MVSPSRRVYFSTSSIHLLQKYINVYPLMQPLTLSFNVFYHYRPYICQFSHCIISQSGLFHA